jgi:hypothetical protein
MGEKHEITVTGTEQRFEDEHGNLIAVVSLNSRLKEMTIRIMDPIKILIIAESTSDRRNF